MKNKFLLLVASVMIIFSFFACGFSNANQTNFKSKSALLISADTGEVLFEHNADEKRPIASMVKIMTLLLCFENLEKGDRLSLGGVCIRLRDGDIFPAFTRGGCCGFDGEGS